MKFSDLRKYMKELWQMLNFMSRSYIKSYYLGMTISGILLASFQIAFANTISDLTAYAQTGNVSFMYEAIISIVGTILMISLFLPISEYLITRSIIFSMQEIKERLYIKICKLSTSYLEQIHSGELLTRMNNDVTVMEVTFKEHYKSIIVQLFTAVGLLATMFFLYDWRFASFSLLIVIVSLAVNLRFTNKVRNINDQIQSLFGKTTEKFSEFISGFQIIKMFNMVTLYQRYQKLSTGLANTYFQLGKVKAKIEATNYFVNYSTFGGVLVVGVILFSNGQIGLDVVIGLVILQMNLTQVFLNAGSTLSWIQTSLAGADRINELLQAEEEQAFSVTDSSLKPIYSESLISLHHVEFAYQPDQRVLSDLSMSVKQEQVIAVVGSSGSGKSTLIKLLLGLYPVSSGEIQIMGESLTSGSLENIRALMAYVPQDAFLFTGTIEENIRQGHPHASMNEVFDAAKAAYAHEFIMQLPEGYQTILGERGTTLSGGQRQRIAIARAILKNAPILLLDEATSALDNESEYWVQQALHQLMRGRTTIIIAHRLSTIQQADYIYVMDQGMIVEQGSHQELLELGGYYARLYEGQFAQKLA